MMELTSNTCGCIDSTNGDISTVDLAYPEVNDVFDDLGGIALNKRAEVIIVRRERMPTKTVVVYCC